MPLLNSCRLCFFFLSFLQKSIYLGQAERERERGDDVVHYGRYIRLDSMEAIPFPSSANNKQGLTDVLFFLSFFLSFFKSLIY